MGLASSSAASALDDSKGSAATSSLESSVSSDLPDDAAWEQLPGDILERILADAGAWRCVADGPVYGAWSVCRTWRDTLWCSDRWPETLAGALGCLYGGAGEALRRYAARLRKSRTSATVRPAGVLPAALLRRAMAVELPNWGDGELLVRAAAAGDAAAVCALLSAPEHAARADSKDGDALIAACRAGHEGIARTLLEWPSDAVRADCQGGWALVVAAMGGHEPIVRMLLRWPRHAPAANCRQGHALVFAARGGHAGIVRLLLDPQDAGQYGSPRGNPKWRCCHPTALEEARYFGHKEVVRLLLT